VVLADAQVAVVGKSVWCAQVWIEGVGAAVGNCCRGDGTASGERRGRGHGGDIDSRQGADERGGQRCTWKGPSCHLHISEADVVELFERGLRLRGRRAERQGS